MPYIKQHQRDKLDPIIAKFPQLDDGELNYTVTRLIHQFIMTRKFKYVVLARVIGTLVCVVLELYLRVVLKYEDKKKAENGNISDLDGDI